MDDKNVRRRFRASNYQSTTRVKPFICTMPMRLDEGWNQIQFNLSDFTRRAYGTNYIETLRVQVNRDLTHSTSDNSCLINFERKDSWRHFSYFFKNYIFLKPFFRFTQTVAFVESTSPIVYTVRTSYPPSSSSTCPFRIKQRQRHKIKKNGFTGRDHSVNSKIIF